MNLAAFKTLIQARCGLTFEGVGEAPLVTGLQQRIHQTGTQHAARYYTLLQENEAEFHELVCLLTINETFFYREAEQIHWVVDHLIPRLLTDHPAGTPLRIFSAGCSTGEEPYSLAIALREKYGERATHLFSVTGGDIDKHALEKARDALYTEFSFRSLSPQLSERYFTREGKWARRVNQDVRHQVRFHHINLLDAQHHHSLRDFDIIFFRNVSIYFDTPTRQQIQRHLAALLKPNGYLLLGMAETLANDLGVLTLQEEQGLFYFSQQATVPPPSHRTPLPTVKTTTLRPPPPPAVAPRAPVAHTHTPALPPVSTPEQRLAEAQQLIRDKHYEPALSLLEPLLAQQQHAAAARLLKAHILLQRKAYAAAAQLAQDVIDQDAWSIDAWVLRGLAAKWQDQHDTAVSCFKQAVYGCNECWPAHYYLAELYRAEPQPDKARRAYRSALHLLAAAVLHDGLRVIPLDLPVAEVRFLCTHQLAKLDNKPNRAAG